MGMRLQLAAQTILLLMGLSCSHEITQAGNAVDSRGALGNASDSVSNADVAGGETDVCSDCNDTGLKQLPDLDSTGDAVSSVDSAIPDIKKTVIGTICTSSILSQDATPVAVVATDLSGDGEIKIAILSADWTKNALLLNVYDKMGEIVTSTTIADQYNYMTTLDSDGDGASELMLGNAQGKYFTVFRLAKGQLIGKNVSMITGTNACIADVDGDGKQDLIVQDHEEIIINHSNGDGTFVALQSFAINSATLITSADFNADGKVDIAIVVDYLTVKLFLGSTAGYQPAGSIVLPNNVQQPQARAIQAGDLDGDGLPELVVVMDNKVWALKWSKSAGLMNISNVDWVLSAQYSQDSYGALALGADFPRVLVYSGSGGGLVMYRFEAGKFQLGVTLVDSTGTAKIVSVDLDGDDAEDWIAATPGKLYLFKTNCQVGK